MVIENNWICSLLRRLPLETYDSLELQQHRRPLISYIKNRSNHGRFYLLRTYGWKSLAQSFSLPHGTYLLDLLEPSPCVQSRPSEVTTEERELS